MANGPRILVIEDDASISLGVRMNLEAEGYQVEVCEDGASGLDRARSAPWDLVILDVMLPRMNGYEFLCALRAQRDRTPVLMLSAKSDEVDKIMGLDLGADDYVTKPFSVGELMARVRVMLRRRQVAPPEPVAEPPGWKMGDIRVDPDTREVHKDGGPVELTATEFDVLAVLLRANGRILSRRQIMDAVWGPEHHGTERTVDNFVAQLRAKLEADPAHPAHLVTVRGVGYRVVDA